MLRTCLVSTLILAVPTEAMAWIDQQEGAGYGTALAAGDFDCHGGLDLAIGVPYQTVNGIDAAGLVHVQLHANFYGGKFVYEQTFSQATAGIAAVPEAGDMFGFELASGDFNDDGCDDLAIGTPFEAHGNIDDGGVVHVLYGSLSGLTTSASGYFHQDTSGIVDTPGPGDVFGSSLTSGDFNNDGFDDLAIGAPGEEVDGKFGAGQVHVLSGGPSGLAATGSQVWNQSSSGIADTVETSDGFGASLAAGNFAGSAHTDLAIGITGENTYAGAASIVRGSASGLTSASSEFWTQDSSGVVNSSQAHDQFAYDLAAGNFNGDGFNDLAISVPFELVGTVVRAGAVHVFHGASSGMTPVGFFHQDTTNVEEFCDLDDYFGWSLAAGDFDQDGRDDLAVGVPWEDLEGNRDAGAVNILYGSSSGITASGDQLIVQGVSAGEFVYGHVEAHDRFGWALEAGGFVNLYRRPDLAVSAVNESVDGVSYSGMVSVVVYGGGNYFGPLGLWADGQDTRDTNPLD